MHAQVNKVDRIHAIEQHKQTSDYETRVSSLSPDPAVDFSSVDSSEACIPANCFPLSHDLLAISHSCLLCVGPCVDGGRVGDGQGHFEAI